MRTQKIIVWISLTLIWSVSAAETLRVATYNLENYLEMDRTVAEVWRPDYPKPEAEKQIIREVIHQAGADILLVQELGSSAYLEELRLDLASEGLLYKYALHLAAADTSRQIGVLSRIAPSEVVRHTDLEFKYFGEPAPVWRGLLEVIFEAESGTGFSLFGLHLKSRWTTDERDPQAREYRTRSAEACRDRVIERTVERGELRYLIAGDFNDHPSSSAFRRFYQRGDLKLGSLLRAEDSRGELWTYFYAREVTYQLIDSMVLSPELMPHVKGGRGGIIDHPQALEGSDHRLVYVDLEF